MRQIFLNTVYTLHDPVEDIVRLLAFVDHGTVAVVISLIKKNPLPYMIDADTFVDDLESGQAKESSDYPPAFCALPSPAQQAAIKRAWDVIGSFVLDIPACYDPKIRSRCITAKCRETGLSRTQIQRYLYRFWAGGMTQHALCPQYNKRGAPGQSRKMHKGKEI